jgi:hypothetical protein
MKTLMKTINPALAVLVLAGGAISQTVQAVVPAPDGGYPGANTAEGQSALFSLTTGGFNTAVGFLSLRSNTTSSLNTAVGAGALLANTDGNNNTATGAGALLSDTVGYSNTANGSLALFTNTQGNDNTASGAAALYLNSSGDVNTANGLGALGNNSTGSGNTALGAYAGSQLTTGDNNIDIGYNVVGVAGESNTIRIGNTDVTDTFIRGISGATSSGGAAVFVNGNGKLGTMTSSARFKDEIKPMDKASEAILALRPVSFRYKKEIDPRGIPQFGLIAEEVERVNPDLIIRDAAGKPQTVRYEQVNAMLLNEFLKEHRKVDHQSRKIQEQETTITQLKSNSAKQEAAITQMKEDFQSKIAQQQRQIEALTTGLQKVSDQLAAASPSRGGLELNEATPKVVHNSR